VNFGERKIPEKVLKSIEDKAVKGAKFAAPPIAMVRDESRKRKEFDASKTVAKKRKLTKNAKHASAEEMAESTHDGSGAARLSIGVGRSEASVARRWLHQSRGRLSLLALLFLPWSQCPIFLVMTPPSLRALIFVLCSLCSPFLTRSCPSPFQDG